MSDYAEKTQAPKNILMPNRVYHKQNNSHSTPQFIDNRQDSAIQKKLQEMANHRDQTAQLKSDNTIIQKQKSMLSRWTRRLPYIPEKWKERTDPRRWTFNPYWQYYNQEEVAFEKAHKGPYFDANGVYIGAKSGGYHSRERHGGEHQFNNIHARTQDPKGGNLTSIGPSVMMHLGHPVLGYIGNNKLPMPSSQFATPAWHTYSRNKAEEHVTLIFSGLTWPKDAAPKKDKKANEDHQFTIEYEDTPAGFSVDGLVG